MNSSNSLFHFTKQISILKSILGDRLYGTYCKEVLNYNNEKTEIIVPMISFTDMPLANYAKKPVYGKFGIGLNKNWGIKNRLNPVIYIDKNSILFETQINAFHSSLLAIEKLKQVNYKSKEEFQSVKKPFEFLRYILFYFKHYQDDLYRESINKIYKDYRFYNEREWRYIPDTECAICDLKISVEEYNNWRNDKSVKKEKPLIKDKVFLEFDFSDIDWVLIQNKAQIKSLVKFFNNLDDSYFKNIDREILFTKIITFEDINK
jgi:hypothetical protein